MKKYILTLAIFTCSVIMATNKETKAELYQVDPLIKVLYTDTHIQDKPDTVRVARGENAIFQMVLRGDCEIKQLAATVKGLHLGKAKIGWVHDVHNTNTAKGDDNLITTPENNYPDPIFDDQEESLERGKFKTLWVDIDVPRDAKAGLHKGSIQVTGIKDGKAILLKKKVFVQVHPVTLPKEQQLKVVNWYFSDPVSYLNDQKPIEPKSDRYLELLSKIVETGAEYGQNCWLTQENPDVLLNADSTDFYLDFTYFDKAVEVFQKYGNMKYLCNNHFGGRATGAAWNEAMVFNLRYVKNKQIVTEQVSHTDPRLKPYIKKYYGQIEKHLREKGWLDFCYQHIADEPDNMGSESQKSWSAVAAMLKEAAPGLKTIDASFEIIENQDVSVVLLGENIDKMPPVPTGSERWMYTCTGPQGNFANRFVQQPLMKTRILHWINYKYNECGYLHWGFNYWGASKDPLHDVTPNTDWPGGDCYIIYPGKEKVYPSIRLCSMRDGIRDYDLLKMVERISPEKANNLCNSIILGPDSYNLEVQHFRKIRKEMLEFLSRHK